MTTGSSLPTSQTRKKGRRAEQSRASTRRCLLGARERKADGSAAYVGFFLSILTFGVNLRGKAVLPLLLGVDGAGPSCRSETKRSGPLGVSGLTIGRFPKRPSVGRAADGSGEEEEEEEEEGEGRESLGCISHTQASPNCSFLFFSFLI